MRILIVEDEHDGSNTTTKQEHSHIINIFCLCKKFQTLNKFNTFRGNQQIKNINIY